MRLYSSSILLIGSLKFRNLSNIACKELHRVLLSLIRLSFFPVSFNFNLEVVVFDRAPSKFVDCDPDLPYSWLIGASTTKDTTAASQTMIEDLNTWILDLQTHAMTAPLGNRKVRKTTVMMVKKRAKNLTYSTVHKLNQVWARLYNNNPASLEGIFKGAFLS